MQLKPCLASLAVSASAVLTFWSTMLQIHLLSSNCSLLPLTCIVADASHSVFVRYAAGSASHHSFPYFCILMLHALQAAQPRPQQAAAHLPLSPVYKSSCEQFARPLEEPQVHFLEAGKLTSCLNCRPEQLPSCPVQGALGEPSQPVCSSWLLAWQRCSM